MNHKAFGKTKLIVPAISAGSLPMGPSQRHLSLTDGVRVLLRAYEKGMDLWDTAQYYETYPYIRAALETLRSQGKPLPLLSSRSLAETREEMEEAIAEFLTAFSIPKADLFLLHEVRSPEDFRDRSGAWEALLAAKEKGLVTAIGISTHHTDVAEMTASLPEADVLFCLLNKEGLGIRTGDGPGTREAMEAAVLACREAGKGVMVMKALGGGNLSASYVECLDYVSSVPGVDTIVLGMASEEDVDTAAAYEAGRLSFSYAPDVSMKRMHVEQTDCEGCGNCKARCSSGAIFWNENGLAEIDQTKCVRCGYCAPVCPVRAIIFY